MIRAVIIGFSHMHVNEVALYISEHPEMELAAVADVPSTVEAIPGLRYTPLWNLENVKKNYCDNVKELYKGNIINGNKVYTIPIIIPNELYIRERGSSIIFIPINITIIL